MPVGDTRVVAAPEIKRSGPGTAELRVLALLRTAMDAFPLQMT
jgi:hypothetical protein